jgi:hypothetical protein
MKFKRIVEVIGKSLISSKQLYPNYNMIKNIWEYNRINSY